MKRKHFLKISGLSAGSVLVGSSLIGFLAACRKNGTPDNVTEGNFTRLLPIPNVVSGNATLTAQATKSNVSGASINVLGYQPNSLLGPSFRINKGSAVNILLQNNLSEHTNIHWHGLKVPALMDGHPDQLANAGGTFRYQFTINQRAGLSWYHPHPHEKTGKQVFKGLAGLFIINDAEEAALNLPSGQYELPLVIQDKRITSHEITYNPSMMEEMTGFMGETIIVNGVYAPFAEVETRYYRFRILNGSNARIYNLALSTNADMIIIGNDAGLLKKPATVKSILLAPGERLDMLINFAGLSERTELYLESRQFDGAGDAQGQKAFKIMKFIVKQTVSDNFSVPTTLSNIVTLNASASVKTRNFDISNDPMIMGGGRMQHGINAKVFDANRIDETVRANTTEIWVFDNSRGDEPHPMHIHAVQFQVLERTGGRNQLIASEAGWKDTVLVMPGEVVKVIVPFENYTGKFAFHCHNLEHEDSGMMLNFEIV